MGVTNTLYACINAQTNIDNILAAGANPLLQMQQTLGISKALNSSANTAGTSVIPVQSSFARPTSTSNRKVVVQGRVKGCPSVTTAKPDPCAGSTPETSDLVDEEVVVANPNYVSGTLDRTVYQDSCDLGSPGSSQVLAYKLLEGAEAVLKAENRESIVDIVAGVTNYFDGTASTINGGQEKVVNLYSSTAPIIPQPGNMFRVVEEYRRKSYSSITPIVVGGTTIARFVYDGNFYRNNVDGSDILRLPGGISGLEIDYDIDSYAQTIGPNTATRMLTWIPGHVLKLKYLDFAEGSPLRRDNGTITKTTMTFMGEMFDVTLYDADCDDLLDYTIGRHTDTWILDDTFTSVNCGGQESVLSWINDCADTDCDDIDLPENVIT